MKELLQKVSENLKNSLTGKRDGVIIRKLARERQRMNLENDTERNAERDSRFRRD